MSEQSAASSVRDPVKHSAPFSNGSLSFFNTFFSVSVLRVTFPWPDNNTELTSGIKNLQQNFQDSLDEW